MTNKSIFELTEFDSPIGNWMEANKQVQQQRLERYRNARKLSKAQQETIDSYEEGTKKLNSSGTHKKFLCEVGIEVYQQARKRGFSIHGALIYLSLTANEAGYGDEVRLPVAFKYNNYAGLGGSKGLHRHASPSIKLGVKKGLDVLEKRWNNAYERLKDSSVDLKTLDSDLKSGIWINPKTGKYSDPDQWYNTSKHGKAYGTFLGKEMLTGVADRFQTVLARKLKGIINDLFFIESLANFPGWETNTLKSMRAKIQTLNDKWQALDFIYYEIRGYTK